MAHNHPPVHGIDLDQKTRCAHYRGAVDIIAIKMKCCNAYYACKDCHESLADHQIQVWPSREWDQLAILCGYCKTELTIRQYLRCAYTCPTCSSPFNPRCANHHHFYFEERSSDSLLKNSEPNAF